MKKTKTLTPTTTMITKHRKPEHFKSSVSLELKPDTSAKKIKLAQPVRDLLAQSVTSFFLVLFAKRVCVNNNNSKQQS